MDRVDFWLPLGDDGRYPRCRSCMLRWTPLVAGPAGIWPGIIPGGTAAQFAAIIGLAAAGAKPGTCPAHIAGPPANIMGPGCGCGEVIMLTLRLRVEVVRRKEGNGPPGPGGSCGGEKLSRHLTPPASAAGSAPWLARARLWREEERLTRLANRPRLGPRLLVMVPEALSEV